MRECSRLRAGAGAGDLMPVLNRWTTSPSTNTAPGHRTAGHTAKQMCSGADTLPS